MKFVAAKNLVPLKAQANAEIDRQAGEIRKLFITDCPGQGMVYQQKRVEAEAYLADNQIGNNLIPHLALEAQTNGITLEQMANVIIQKSEEWKGLSAAIEVLRLSHKAMVTAATNPADIQAATVIDWSAIQALA